LFVVHFEGFKLNMLLDYFEFQFSNFKIEGSIMDKSIFLSKILIFVIFQAANYFFWKIHVWIYRYSDLSVWR